LLVSSPLSHWERVRVRAFWRIIFCLTCMSLPSPHPLPLSQRARGEICNSAVKTENRQPTTAMPDKSWKFLGARDISDHRIFRIRHDLYRFEPTGAERDFVVLDCPDWVNIIPLTDDGRVVLIRQFRHGTQSVTLEIPGGVVEAGETPEDAAVRELVEETGYVPASVKSLGFVSPNPAIQGNRSHTFLAEGCRLTTAPQPDSFEKIEVLFRPLEDIPGLILNGEISHSLIIAAFALLHYSENKVTYPIRRR
jgi:ADP-ribose pyrophosphatase